MKQSPMLKHAIESFEHGLEHYLDGTERSRKFALLHIDHSIELLIKEKCVRLGKSIFKSDGTTLSVHEAFKSLKNENVLIPEQPRLEDLHDLRNTIQHKGLVPDLLTAQFHVETAYAFANRFLEAELDMPLRDVLPARYRLLMEGPPTSDDVNGSRPSEGEPMDRGMTILASALQEARAAENPTSKIVAGYSVLQQAVRLIAGVQSAEEKVKFKKTLVDAAVRRGVEKARIEKKLKRVLIIRGMALKPDHEAQENESNGLMRAVEGILEMVGLSGPASAAAQPAVQSNAAAPRRVP